jgi:ATP-dependent Clp protease adapter protein ClpS
MAATPLNSHFLYLDQFEGDQHQTKKQDNVALQYSTHRSYQRHPDAHMSTFEISAQSEGGGEREREKSRGRTATIARPVAKPKDLTKEKVDVDGLWMVLLHNDDVHTFDYVNMAIVQTVTTVTRKKAHRIVVQAHSNKMAVVTQTWKQRAKETCLKLQKYGLTSSIAPADRDGSGDE